MIYVGKHVDCIALETLRAHAFAAIHYSILRVKNTSLGERKVKRNLLLVTQVNYMEPELLVYGRQRLLG